MKNAKSIKDQIKFNDLILTLPHLKSNSRLLHRLAVVCFTFLITSTCRSRKHLIELRRAEYFIRRSAAAAMARAHEGLKNGQLLLAWMHMAAHRRTPGVPGRAISGPTRLPRWGEQHVFYILVPINFPPRRLLQPPSPSFGAAFPRGFALWIVGESE